MIISTIGIIGAGQLGTRIGLQAAISGFRVNVYDIQEKSLTNSLSSMKKLVAQLSRAELINEEIGLQALERISFTYVLKEAVQQVDLISESVTEDADIKTKVWKEIGSLASSHTIFTTNTSYLLPSQFAGVSGRPEKFCAFHFHDVFHSRVVDIMPHAGTSAAVVSILEELGRRLHQVPILIKKEHSGYIFNTLLIAWIDAAGRLLTGEIAEIEAIDKSWMINFNMSAGPFGILDNVGLDTAWHITNSRRNAASRAFAALLKTYVDQGKMGAKSGEGFYTYPNPRFKDPDFLK
ncbi:3-hydroxyacyl-CoA dehydrogenase NAD-binding domain-containing protein [Algoriphagus sp. C2-6-M1]|uniref:3-hydroxyacyl-CoA dehydrogenase NAD-binding domain-containing protein n=1 Tax=Algoriphagus persicinus TaxID=3108754 RepID=UPI002B3CDBBD|nr:3-hydroxyacyl-CoA dehydrogenase NAD-binding domain-containing protein [Algoriphagus sp. C2-6-M1]MEB2780524.1 3-hydroxyacyl-CoA dehydrogenase NAD-binding domain-containing protein [Algoriphagus sp. C2-6-M1]